MLVTFCIVSILFYYKNHIVSLHQFAYEDFKTFFISIAYIGITVIYNSRMIFIHYIFIYRFSLLKTSFFILLNSTFDLNRKTMFYFIL